MESLLSEKFRDLVLKYLDAPNICVATISSVYEDSFIKSIKGRDDVVVVEISAENREGQEKCISQLLSESGK